MEFPDSYFEDEVREGFYVPSLMKRCWAAQAEVLDAVQKICAKHNIKYFAEWGTMLGAVRHGGRVPWDDDIDICMLREDYDRFRAVADDELPDGCWFMDYRWNDDFDHLVGRIINSRVLIVEGDALERYHGFPYVAGIDIFWLDYLPADPGEEESYLYLLRYVLGLIYKIKMDKTGEIPADPQELEFHIHRVEELCHTSIDRDKPVKQQLYALLEKNVAPRYLRSGAKEVTNLPRWKDVQGYRLPIECYAEGIRMPFENTEVVVPVGYDELLRRKYGAGWMQPVQSGSSHEFPSYAEQQEFLEEESAGELFEYRFSMEEMKEAEAARLPKETLRGKVRDFLPLFHEAHEEIRSSLERGDVQAALGILGECQNVAVELGTMIEGEKGEGHSTVRVLEQYCEAVFQLYERLGEEGADGTIGKEGNLSVLASLTSRLSDSIEHDLKEKREVVFLPYKVSLWGAMESVWRAAVEDGDTTSVTVIPIPYYYKDAYGRVKSEEPHYETAYPDDVPVVSYEDYNFEVHHPDIIVIQCPYDEYNYGLSVHPFFYAKNLKKYTDKLAYIPPLVMDEIGPGAERARKTLKSFCNMPGVVHADMVIVQSEQMKEVYVELLTEFAGEDTRGIWEEKILGLGSPAYDAGNY